MKPAFAGVARQVRLQTSMREANDRGAECRLAEDATASYFPAFKAETVRAEGAIAGWATAPRRAREGDRLMNEPFDPEALVDATAPLLGIAMTPESRTQTVLHLRIAAEQAALLLSADIGDGDEPAPVFTP